MAASLACGLWRSGQNYLKLSNTSAKQRQTILPETERMLITKLRKITVTSTSTKCTTLH